MVEVLVEHDYSAQEPDELNIKKGDIIKDVIKKPGGWWEGTLHNKRGMFPDNFVRLIEMDSVILRQKKDSVRTRQCKVIFSYSQDHEDELNLKVGDIINIIGEEEEGWWRGVLNGKEGVFPSNFVEELTAPHSRPKPSTREDLRFSDEAPVLPAKPAKQLYEVRYAYVAQNEDELSIKEGDVIVLLSKDGQDPGWWKGELNGKIGVFPDNFVELLPSSIDDKRSSSKLESKPTDTPNAIKPSSIASQRKSLEFKNGQPKSDVTKGTPPIPGKKPIISIKKSPSSSGSGLFSKLKDKIVDAVDGATGSKSKTELAKEAASVEGGHVFDQVERRPLLGDVRANRARAPGRRLPTTIYKEDEEEQPGLPNGTVDHHKLEQSTKSEDSFKSEASFSSENLDNSFSAEIDAADTKPKLREWEKHKAPWLEEMKLNQAKRTSVSPVPEVRPKVIPETKPESEASRSSQNSPAEKEFNVVDMSKSMSDIKLSPVEVKPLPKPYKTPPNELDKGTPIKGKPVIPSVSSVGKHITGSSQPSKDLSPKSPSVQPIKVSPKLKSNNYENVSLSKPSSIPISTTSTNVTNITSGFTSHSSSTTHSSSYISHSSSFPHSSNDKVNISNNSNAQSSKIEASVSLKQFNDVLERLLKLELKCEKQAQLIEDLDNRLKVETDMRMMLQEKIMQNNVQV